VYVDDAFACVHRAHASVHGLAKLYRDRGCGLLLEKEVAALGRIIAAPDKPYVAILGGGGRLSEKIALVESLLERVTTLIIGGAIANTLLAALGNNMQASLVEVDKLALARSMLDKARSKGVEVVLPVDLVVAASAAASASEAATVGVYAIPAGTMALDIGPRSVAAFLGRLDGAKTIFWNGPVGLFERATFSTGTIALARALADSSGFTLVCGGAGADDSAAAVHAAGEGLAAKMKHISTGGEASLELIEGKKLPGIEVLRRAEA
jgi:phosphoglycerate kinase